jgi:hypothetical protein
MFGYNKLLLLLLLIASILNFFIPRVSIAVPRLPRRRTHQIYRTPVASIGGEGEGNCPTLDFLWAGLQFLVR